MIKNILIGIIVFLLVGELLIRVDQNFNTLNNGPEKIEVKIEESEEYNLVKNKKLIIRPSDLRIMILGDSYIHGGGINPQKKFSKILKQSLLKQKTKFENIYMLDVSRPDNNTLDNFNTFSAYYDYFQPNIIIWGYNYNDILGGLKVESKSMLKKNSSEIYKRTIVTPEQAKKEVSSLQSFTKKIYKYSELLRYVSSKIQNRLKLNGIVLPIGDFYFLTKISYKSDSEIWNLNAKLISNVSEKCKGRSRIIFYKMPEFNLLSRRSLFTKCDESLINFISSHAEIEFIDGFDNFPVANSADYMLSKYDGHPNEKAHGVIAKVIEKKILGSIK